uniref:Uncharacterized protein n=1 Tax=Daphnia galeata TaxID=27404 RepID=A0A8J2WAT7_9CRUS|nr:unnamed protein product [Daphnia galeata]
MSDANFSNNSSTNGWFTEEIQKIMYGFGDSKHALKETAESIETVLKEQLIQLLNALFEVAAKRNSKTIGMKDFLFLLRHRPVKLKRFYEYLVVSGRGFKKLAKEVDVTKDTESEFCDTSIEAGNKEMNSALAYLQHIDPSGNLLCAVTTTKFADDTNKERKERMDRMTTAMNLLEYKEYHKIKSTSFQKIQHAGKFKDWLLKDSPNPEVTLSAKTWSTLCFFAHETIAEIVDLAFIVRRDNTVGHEQITWSRSMKPLQTAEVMEAIRRFNNTNNSFSTLFGRKAVSPTSYRLLAL